MSQYVRKTRMDIGESLMCYCQKGIMSQNENNNEKCCKEQLWLCIQSSYHNALHITVCQYHYLHLYHHHQHKHHHNYPLRLYTVLGLCSKDTALRTLIIRTFKICSTEKRMTSTLTYIATNIRQVKKKIAVLCQPLIKAKCKLFCLGSQSPFLWRYCLWKYYYRILFKWEAGFMKSLIHIQHTTFPLLKSFGPSGTSSYQLVKAKKYCAIIGSN